MKRNKTVALVGAALGFGIFLAVALLPSLLYGGYAGLMLATGIFGEPVPSHLFARGLVVFGMVLAIFGVASVFTVAGAAVATAVGGAIKAAAPEAKPAAEHAHASSK